MLADVTSFGWDTVHVLSEGATSRSVEDAVGAPVVHGERYYDAGNLLVLMDGDEVLRAITVLPDLLVTRTTSSFSAQVEMVPHGSGTPALLLLRALTAGLRRTGRPSGTMEG